MTKPTSKSKSAGRRPQAVPLVQRQQVFLDQLQRDGYLAATIGQYRRTIERMISLMAQRGLGATDLDEQLMGELSAFVLDATPQSSKQHASFCLNRFRKFLIELGDAPPRAALNADESARGRLRREYADYLRNQRGLSDATIYHCIRFFERFMTYRFDESPGDLNAIKPEDIVAFMLQLGKGPRTYRDKTPPTHLRNLFKFLFWARKTKRDLSASIPRVTRHKPTNIPRYLCPDDVARLVQAVHTDDALGRRNYAMLLLIARLGLRAPEVIAILLQDIDWRAGEILIRGKGKLHDRMPLPSDVGEAIVDYIRNGRRGDSRALFVSSRPPFQAFKDAQIVNCVLHAAYDKTSLNPPQSYVGSHVFRHSLATDMLRKGASLDEIGDVLRHRSRATTTIYAKHDIDALRSLARAWPAQGDAE